MIDSPQPDFAPLPEANRRMVLSALRRHQQLSRREMTQLTGLNGSTLTYVVRDLLGRDILRTVGKRASQSVGPRHTMLQINPEYGLVAGVGLDRLGATLIIADAAGQVMDQSHLALDHRLDQVPARLRQAVDDRMAQLDLSHRPLLGVGVGVPGVVNTVDGILAYSVAYNVRNFPLRQMLDMAFDHRPVVTVDHDANLAALAESRVGAAKGLSHFIYILVNQASTPGTGTFRSFGAALFLNGQIYHGTHFAAGELDCNLLPRIETDVTSDDWHRLHQPDAPLSEVLHLLAYEIGKTITSLISLLDPQAIIVGSNDLLRNHAFIRQIQQNVSERIIPVVDRQMHISAAQLGQEAIAHGAALAAAHASDGRVVSQG